MTFSNGGSSYTTPATGLYYIKFNLAATTATSKFYYLQAQIRSGATILAAGPYVNLSQAAASGTPSICSTAVFMGTLPINTTITFYCIGSSNTSSTNATTGKAAINLVTSSMAVEGETNVFCISLLAQTRTGSLKTAGLPPTPSLEADVHPLPEHDRQERGRGDRPLPGLGPALHPQLGDRRHRPPPTAPRSLSDGTWPPCPGSWPSAPGPTSAGPGPRPSS